MEPKPVRLVLAKDSDLDGNESSLEAVSTGFLSFEEIWQCRSIQIFGKMKSLENPACDSNSETGEVLKARATFPLSQFLIKNRTRNV